MITEEDPLIVGPMVVEVVAEEEAKDLLVAVAEEGNKFTIL